jgi:CRISPR-associated protein Csm5
MSFISQHRLNISTISPIHIGCNETYEPTNYVLDEGALYAFDSISAMKGLSEEVRSKLLDIVSGKPNDHMLKEVQLFFYENRNAIISNSSHIIPVHQNIFDFYKKRIGKTVKSEGKGKNVINKLEIERTMFNPIDHSLFLPGSSIKGAIRTALLDMVNNKRGLKERIEKNQELQQRLFKYEMRTLEKDPMRLVSIADAHQGENINTSLSELNFSVNRKKNLKVKDGKTVISMAESKGPNQILETIIPLHYQLFETQLNLHTISQMQFANNKDKLPDKSFHWTIKDIAKACNKFYFPLLEKEIGLLKELGCVDEDWVEKTQNLILKILPNMTNNQLFLMRIGRHSGAEAETLNGVRKIKIITKDKPRFEKEPTTFWLASHSTDSKTNLIPYGWILVEINPQPESDLKELFQDTANRRQKWLKEKQDFQLNLREKTIQEQKEKEKLALEQVKKEQHQQKEKEAFDNLSDEEKSLIILRKLFQQKVKIDDKTAGGELAQKLNSMLNQVETWNGSVRNDFIDLAEEIYDFIGWGKREKKEKRKSKLKSLRS